ncbi:hypothetical protein Aduo_019564 [Ancylostoma duodenale]
MERIEPKQVLVETQPPSFSSTLVDSSSQTSEGCQMTTNEGKRGCRCGVEQNCKQSGVYENGGNEIRGDES